MVFADRADAGRRLAQRLQVPPGAVPLVLGLPRGGLPVAAEVARVLHAPLDMLGVRKLGAPGNPELGVGAVAEGGGGVLDDATARRFGLTGDVLEAALERERTELDRRVATYRGGHRPLPVRGRQVIVVDDGLATGLTALAALHALRDAGAGPVTVAVPVGSPEAVYLLAQEADDVVCLTIPEQLRSVGQWYEDFRPVRDEEVLAILAAHRDAAVSP